MKNAICNLAITFAAAIVILKVNSAATSEARVVPKDENPAFISFWTQIFTPEGHKMLEKMNRIPCERRTISIKIDYGTEYGALEKKYYAINTLEISDDEDEDSEEYDYDETKTIYRDCVVEFIGHSKSSYIYTNGVEFHRLNEVRVKAAVYFQDFNRLKELVIKKKFRTLKPEDKREIFQLAISNFSRPFYTEDKYQILKLLLDFSFASDFSDKNLENISIRPVIKDDRAVEIILAHDKDFFRRINNSHNYISELINIREFDVAKRALEYGFDPTISEVYDRNALDCAISILHLNRNGQTKLLKEQEQQLLTLIEMLRQVPGLAESMTYANFQRSCEEINITYMHFRSLNLTD